MRYKLRQLEIRTENAAKPPSQQSCSVLGVLNALPPVERALDFGCGKLRYARILFKRSKRLTLVDSRIQIERRQIIFGRRTTVKRYVKNYWKRATALAAEDFDHAREKYDFVLCANVLSAIPCRKARSEALERIRNSLAATGTALFVTQFKNTDFSKTSRSPKAKPYLDGWIIQSYRGPAYYGIIDEAKLVRLLRRHGFHIVRSWTQGQSSFALASGCDLRRAST